MKLYTRKQAEQVLKDNQKTWCNFHDLCYIHRQAINDLHANPNNKQAFAVYHATSNLNGYLLGY